MVETNRAATSKAKNASARTGSTPYADSPLNRPSKNLSQSTM